MAGGFKLDPSAWLADKDVRALPITERGMLVEMLCLAWQNDLVLPGNVNLMANILGVSHESLRESFLWHKIGLWFCREDGPDGPQYRCTYLEGQLKKARAWSDKSREGGRRSGQARKKKPGSAAAEKASAEPTTPRSRSPQAAASSTRKSTTLEPNSKGGSAAVRATAEPDANHPSTTPHVPPQPAASTAVGGDGASLAVPGATPTAAASGTLPTVPCPGPETPELPGGCGRRQGPAYSPPPDADAPPGRFPPPPPHTPSPQKVIPKTLSGGKGGAGEKGGGEKQRSLFADMDEPEPPPPPPRRKARQKPTADQRSQATRLVDRFMELTQTLHGRRGGDDNAAFWLAAGETYDDLLARVEGYAAHCELVGSVGTQFAMSARNFFGRKDPGFRDPRTTRKVPNGSTARPARHDPTRIHTGRTYEGSTEVLPAWSPYEGAEAGAPAAQGAVNVPG